MLHIVRKTYTKKAQILRKSGACKQLTTIFWRLKEETNKGYENNYSRRP